ncbi:hypothetical protein NS226_15000 [Aureimonas ureilytica]|uniref:DUF58 domain-containing protein n=1 Tax=Aureimonas ureilytica TaxID=401562 RepID=A0A175R801_9HYPH|nr:DUF58 domain-containing protein [Aureimonas ureilytica]KTQ92612.1 hypothetical protein NS226_15000 [Aureimonas ureilytica]
MTERELKGPDLRGIVATLPDLVRVRPQRGLAGFAQSGRVATHQWGANRSIYRGRGMEFAESRLYQPGDDVKSIDWRVTARTGHTHTKLFQEERERPIVILTDLRAMMQFGTRSRFKSHLAAEVAAMMAWTGHDGGDRVGGLILTRDGLQDFRPARTRRSVLGLLEALSEETRLERVSGTEVTLAQALRRLRHRNRPGTLAFVISDFSDLSDEAETELRHLAVNAHVTNIQITDPFDAALPPRGGRLTDGEKALAVSVLGGRKLERYAQDFEARRERLKRVSRQHGMVCHFLQTPDDPASILRPHSNLRLAA